MCIKGCQYGWEYDTTWYKMTVSSQEDWVCDKELYVANAIFFCRMGEAIGSLALGQLADMWVLLCYIFIVLNYKAIHKIREIVAHKVESVILTIIKIKVSCSRERM